MTEYELPADLRKAFALAELLAECMYPNGVSGFAPLYSSFVPSGVPRPPPPPPPTDPLLNDAYPPAFPDPYASFARESTTSRRMLRKMAYDGPKFESLKRKKKDVPVSLPTPSNDATEKQYSVELGLARPLLTRCATVMSRTLMEAEVKSPQDKRKKLLVFFSNIPPPIIGGERSTAGHKIPEQLKVAPSYRSFINRFCEYGFMPMEVWEKAKEKQNVEHCLDIIMPTMFPIMTKLDEIMRRSTSSMICGMHPMIMVESDWKSVRGRHLLMIRNEVTKLAKEIWAKEKQKILNQLDEVPQGEDAVEYTKKEQCEIELSRAQNMLLGKARNMVPGPKSDVEVIASVKERAEKLKRRQEMAKENGVEITALPEELPPAPKKHLITNPVQSIPTKVRSVSDAMEPQFYAQHLAARAPLPPPPPPPPLPSFPRPFRGPAKPNPRRQGLLGPPPPRGRFGLIETNPLPTLPPSSYGIPLHAYSGLAGGSAYPPEQRRTFFGAPSTSVHHRLPQEPFVCRCLASRPCGFFNKGPPRLCICPDKPTSPERQEESAPYSHPTEHVAPLPEDHLPVADPREELPHPYRRPTLLTQPDAAPMQPTQLITVPMGSRNPAVADAQNPESVPVTSSFFERQPWYEFHGDWSQQQQTVEVRAAANGEQQLPQMQRDSEGLEKDTSGIIWF